LAQALEQLEIFISPSKKIQPRHVQELIGGYSSQTVFDFARLVGQGSFAQASRLLDELMALGEPLVRLFSLLARHFKQLKLAQEGLTKRLGEAEMATLLKVHPFFVKEYVGQAKQISSQRLNEIQMDLLPTDRLLKSSPLNARLVLDRFLMKACRM
jgi:DNA polymerase-3 subunit delta